MTNPYAAPQSPITNVPEDPLKKPMLVWLILIWTIIGVLSGTISTLMMATGNMPIVSEVHRRVVESTSWMEYLLSAVIMFVYLAAAIQLFRLKNAAVRLFVIFVALSACNAAIHWAREDYRAMLEAGGVIGLVSMSVGYVIPLAMLGYACVLRKRGRLH